MRNTGGHFEGGLDVVREQTPAIGRENVLSKINALKEAHVHNLQDMDNPQVVEAYEAFKDWAAGTEKIPEIEDRLIEYLEQYMVMFDAGWVNSPKELKEIDEALEEQLAQAKDDSFNILKSKIEGYRREIKEKLAEVKN
jgi:hypothetical protein